MEESYYGVLGLRTTSSIDDIRRAYRKLAMQWHPDKWANNPAMLGEAKLKFQKIQEAYSVLSDPRKRTLYDAGMYDPFEEEVDEEKPHSLEDLQSMFDDLVRGFQSPQWFPNPSVLSNQGCTGVLPQEAKSSRRDSNAKSSNFGMFGMSSYCR